MTEQNLYSWISWKLFMMKIHFDLFSPDVKGKIARKLYCNKGYHKLTHGSISEQSWKKGKKHTVRSDYLRCKHCRYVFFTNPAEKKKYSKLNGYDNIHKWLRSKETLKS